jgi:Copper transport outer membrane protein, MctB
VIDFRYHIVSIVSIFIALAVGIVLGAGPLQQQLGETLTQQVTQLRQDKADLRSQLGVAQRSQDAGEKFATDVAGELVRGRLVGRSVLLVRLPGADSSQSEEMTKTLAAAGAEVAGSVEIKPSWTDPQPEKVKTREEVARSLGPQVGLVSAAGSLEERMAGLAAKALVTPSGPDAGRRSAASARALTGLQDAGLLSVPGNAVAPATLAVVISGRPDPGTAEPSRKADLSGWVALANGLDGASNGAVVAGPVDSAQPAGVIGVVRDDEALARWVSTVDDLGLSMGRIAVVLALGEQTDGKVGHYGTGPGADQVLPRIPAGTS